MYSSRVREKDGAPFVLPGRGKKGHLVEPKGGWRRIFDRDELTRLSRADPSGRAPRSLRRGRSETLGSSPYPRACVPGERSSRSMRRRFGWLICASTTFAERWAAGLRLGRVLGLSIIGKVTQSQIGPDHGDLLRAWARRIQ